MFPPPSSASGRIAREAGDVDDLTVEERRNRKEAEEAWKIPYQRFSPDLFADVDWT